MNDASIDLDSIKNINLSIQMNRWLLKPLGVWPVENEDSRLERFINFFINSVCYGLFLVSIIPCAAYLMFEEKEIYMKIRLTGPISFLSMGFVKYYILIDHSSKIQECIDYVKFDWRTIKHRNDRSVMIESAQFGRRLIVISTSFMVGSATFYYILKPANVGKITAEDDANLTFIPLPFPIPTSIIDVRQSPSNEILYLIQILSGFLSHVISAGACGLTATLAMHVCGQIGVVMLWLEHLVDGREDFRVSVDHRVSMIVEHHVRIRSFISLIEKTLRSISFVELTGCTLNMCLLGYYLITEGRINKTNYVTFSLLHISVTYNIFIICYIGELLNEQCERLGDMAYMTDWYRLPGRSGLALILIMSAAKTTKKLTAGNLIELSLASFGDVFKASIAYLNILRKVTV